MLYNSYYNALKARTTAAGRQLKEKQKAAARKVRMDSKLPEQMPIKSSIKFDIPPDPIDLDKIPKRKIPVTNKKSRKNTIEKK